MSSFVLAFLVLSFVLTIGLLVQIIGYVMDGVPMRLVGEFCIVSLPETLQWSMPLALLVSAVLVFSRMSADSEVAAMRACGINLYSVMKWPALFAFVCTVLSFWVNNEVVPRGHEIRRTLKSRVSVGAGLGVLEPGKIIDDFPKVKIYFGAKEGNWLYDLVVLDFSNDKVKRTITADKALVTQRGSDIDLDLYRMTVEPVDENHRTLARANRFLYTMENVIRQSEYTRRTKDFRFREIRAKIRNSEEQIARGEFNLKGEKVSVSGEYSDKERRHVDELLRKLRENALCDLSCMRVELNKRLVFAMASICFVLVGIPLGIRSQRKESTVGMAISLAVSLGYYAIVLLMLSFEENYSMRPDILIWLPVVASFLLAARFVRKHL